MVNYYMDRTNSTNALTGTVTFTAGGGLTGVLTLFTTELKVNDYVRVSNGTEWYKVTVITTNLVATIAPVFQQGTVTDGAGTTLMQKVAAGWGAAVNDGTTVAKAAVHPNILTTFFGRAAGDVLYMRRGQTHILSGVMLTLDESGSTSSPITMTGDDGTGWPLEVALAQPIISWGSVAGNFYLAISNRNYWNFTNFDVTACIANPAAVYGTSGGLWTFTGVNIYNNVSTTGGVNLTTCIARFVNCTFYDNGVAANHYSIVTNGADLTLIGCTFNGGATGTYAGLFPYNSHVWIENTTFGVTTAHANSDILNSSYYGQIIEGRNVTFGSGAGKEITFATPSTGVRVSIEDYGGTKLDNRTFYFVGQVNSDATARPGGASTSAKMSPAAYCATATPLILCPPGHEMSRWCLAGNRSVSLYIRGYGWAVFPTATELYVEVVYYAGATATRTKAVTAATVIADNVTWVNFNVPFVLNSDSPVYVTAYLKKYTINCGVYVDILPVWS